MWVASFYSKKKFDARKFCLYNLKMWFIVGLGNPGEAYELTRHNTGQVVLAEIDKAGLLPPKKAQLIELDSMMNNSGKAVCKLVKSKKAAQNLVVIYDDLDLPIGTYKLSYNRGDGGHRGLGSIIRALKTREFLRVRVGIAPSTPSGKVKKPKGEEAVIKFILGQFKPAELATIKKLAKKISSTLEVLVADGREKAMSVGNS